MPGLFMTNTVWYLLVFAAGAAAFIAALAKSDNRRFTAAFTVATVGLFYMFEYVLVLLDAYAYSPGIFPDDAFLDIYMGNVFSQTSIAAASALFIVCRLKWYWAAVFAAAYYLIELLFVRLGIFEVYWYKTIYTPFILVPLLLLLRAWHDRAFRSGTKMDGILLHFLGVLAVSANTVSFPLRLMELFVFTGGFFPDPSKDHTTTGTIFNIILVGALVAAWRSERRRLWAPAAFAGLFAFQFISWQAGLIAFPAQWFAAISLLDIAAFYLWVCAVGRCVRAGLARGGAGA